MSTNETGFQAFADQVVEQLFALAELVDVKVELIFCLQQVQGPDPNEGLAYLLRNGEADTYLATDSQGRMWFCDCSRQLAREITPTTDFRALSNELLGALGCPAIGWGRFDYN